MAGQTRDGGCGFLVGIRGDPGKFIEILYGFGHGTIDLDQR